MQFSALKASIDTVPNPASLFERGTPLDVVPRERGDPYVDGPPCHKSFFLV
jgi:hypothetical protein